MIAVEAQLLLLFLLLVIFFDTASLVVSTSLSTIAISKVGDQTVVCALVQTVHGNNSVTPYTLKCASVSDATKVESYASGDSFYYAGIAAGDGFLCGLSNHYPGTYYNVSAMRWWEFPDQAKNTNVTKVKRLYHGPLMVKLSSGDSHVCGIVGDDRRIDCWRWVGFDKQKVPSNLTDIAVGGRFVCVVLSNGNIKCYSDCDEETDGVVGHEPNGTFIAVDAGDRHACGLKNTGYLYCWGDGAPKSKEFFNQNKMDQYVSMALGDNSTCAIREDQTVACWGNQKDDDEDFSFTESLRSMTFLSITAKGGVFCGVEKTMYCMFCWRGRRSEPGFGSNYTVRPFDLVLPGPCVRGCSNTMEGAGRLCPPHTTICEVKLAPKTLPSPPPPATPSGDSGKRKSTGNKRKIIKTIVVPIVSGIVVISVLGFAFFKYRQRKSRRSQIVHVEQPSPFYLPGVYGKIRQELDQTVDERLTQLISRGHSNTLECFTFEMLLRITGDFSEEKRIGTGGFGSVYRGLLDDGREVAVKRAEKPPSTSGSRFTGYNRFKEKKNAFMAELGLLTQLNHRNLVRLIGFCREDAELVLVYEYMANGTLKDHIQNAPKSPISSWKTRITIALNTARGIDYLHNYAVPAIIHRDIKSSNILLDDTWTAKVSDFGLCLVYPVDNDGGCDGSDDHIGGSYTSLRTAGTLGYMDPEYYRTHCLTTKSDVYSFGVVLLEILTGCKAIHFEGNREGSFDGDVPRNVVDFAPPHIENGALHNVLDPRLPPPRPSEIEGVQILGDLAAHCVQLEGRKRPGITDVVRILEMALGACDGDQLFFRSMTAHSA